MPIYSFKCAKGHEFDVIGKLSERDEPRTCQQQVREDLTDFTVICGEKLERQMALNAASFPGADSWRK